MSPTVKETPNTDGTVCNTVNREEGILRDFPTSSVTPSAMRELCEKHYAQILLFMVEKSHNEKLKDVRSRLTYREDTEQETESASRHRKRKRRRGKQKEIQKSPSPTRSRSVFSRLGSEKEEDGEKIPITSIFTIHECVLPSRIQEARITKERCEGTHTELLKTVPEEDTGRDDPEKPEKMKVIDYPNHMMRNPPPLLLEESTSLFSPKGFGCPPLSARLWSDELPPESIDSFKHLRRKFLAHYLQWKKYTKDLVELCHVKQKEGESTKAFMKRYTSESMMFKGAPELMRIFGFMHGITHPGLIKSLNDNIPKTVDEMMSVTKAFFRREKAATTQSKRRGQIRKQQDFQKPRQEQGFERKKDFRRHPRDRRGDRFTPLTKTPKEILAIEDGKGIFTPLPPMPGSPESRNKNKYCDFHGDKGYNTDNCLHLKRQIKEAVKSRHLAHLVKEIKQGSNKASTSKPVKRQKQPKKTKELLSHPDIGGNTGMRRRMINHNTRYKIEKSKLH
ncbi:hypothetical protein Tco_0676597 [Tanacetum coccineum]